MDFKGFSTDSFEQFIRALALKVLGGGVTVFGNGPDGGREATFQGKVNFPHPPAELWEGYGVVQAKFKEKIESTKKDQAWAVQQLNAELTQWEKSNERNPKPEYFIFCTNVELSSAARGGRAAVEKVFNDHCQALALKGYAIWDANQLKGYVDGYEEIRKRFACFFTTGDLLSEFGKALSRVPDPDAILTAYLAGEILADEDARLSQAGDRSEDRIRLANVFIDLPVALSSSTEPPEEEEQGKPPAGSLHELLRTASHKLDSLALYEQRELSDRGTRGPECVYGRFVFIGGPGSGKSTIGQFFAQIQRAALLDRRPPHRLEEKIRTIVKDIKARCKEEEAHWPRTPRYPFRVELNAFAKALAAGAENGVLTLSEYLRKHLSRDFALTHEDLRDWLRAFPWVLILDGLDEVPSSSNRREVVAAIQSFLNETRDVEADLMIVSSSRPDGYAGEFDGDEVAQRYLLPLSKSRALACAQRYVTAKTATKGDQRAAEAMTTLTSAIDNPLVARLMRSPLQVTFMVTVVAASGKPSESRWQLFNDYYRTIYERELQKAVRPFDKVLNERRQDIDALHHRVGFILQHRAESSGGTQADLSIAEFEQVVTVCLEENGLRADELKEQREMILGAANLRLVFLTSRTPGRLSFDIRSLQEYMAAACITNADSPEVMYRLDVIAHSAYWRNTLLFAIGRFFVEPQMRSHRDKIRVLCEDLNRKDSARAGARLGSRLALEILESGTIGSVPLFSRSLADCALKLLANSFSGDDDLLGQLSDVYDSSMEEEFQSAIAIWLGQSEFIFTISAWILLLSLEKRGIPWAVKMVAEKWPSTIENSWIILSTWLSTLADKGSKSIVLGNGDLSRLQNLIPRISPKQFSRGFSFEKIYSEQRGAQWLFPLLVLLRRYRLESLQINVHIDEVESGLNIRFNSFVDRKDEDFADIKTLELEEGLHRGWRIIMAVAEFYVHPNIETFASVLEVVADSYESADPDWSFYQLPWPIACCLDERLSKSDMLLLAQQLRDSGLADIHSLEEKELIWNENGINLNELLSPLFQLPLPLAAAVQSASINPEITAKRAELILKAILKGLQEAVHPDVRDTLAWVFSFYATGTEALSTIEPLQLETQLLPSRKRWWPFDLLVNTASFKDGTERWILFYDRYGRMPELCFSPNKWRLDKAPLDFLLRAFRKDPSRLGLLRLAGFWCAAGRRPEAEIAETISLEQFEDPRFRLAAMLVTLARPELTFNEGHHIARYIRTVVAENGEPNSINILVSAIEQHATETPALETLVAELANVIPVDQWNLRARVEVLRNNFLQARPSGFDSQMLSSRGLPIINLR